MDNAIDAIVKPGKGRRPGILEPVPRSPRGAGSSRNHSGISSAERVMLAKAELIELELGERRGELIVRRELLPALQRKYSQVRARMLSIPSKWAAQFAPPSKLRQAEDALRQAIEEALAELSGDGLGD